MMLNSTTIGNKIAEARKKGNLSQANLADKISISPQAVGKWERGESMPDITTLNRLAEIFGVDLNYFSDTFQSISIKKQHEKHVIALPAENSNDEPKERFGGNWDLSNNNWVDCDFSGLKDLKDKFSASNIKNCRFVGSGLADLSLQGNTIDDCDFSRADIRNGKIYASEILRSTFKETCLIDAEVRKCEIKGCDFDNSDFSGTEFIDSTFHRNSIKNVVFKHTSFKNMGFSEITFSGNIEHCSFENCSFRKVKFQDATILNSFFKHNRKFSKVEFLDCKVDRLTYAFLKSNSASMDEITIIE